MHGSLRARLHDCAIIKPDIESLKDVGAGRPAMKKLLSWVPMCVLVGSAVALDEIPTCGRVDEDRRL
jgi:hypothetical protein